MGKESDVVVSSIVEPNRIFVQQTSNPFLPYLGRLNYCMDLCYRNFPSFGLPKPGIQPGTICAAPYNNRWFRAVVVKVIPPSPVSGVSNQTQEQVVVRLVDYGGSVRIPASWLRMIRQDFLTLPFLAVECVVANVAPHSLEKGWTFKEYQELITLTKNRILKAQVIGHGGDGRPLVYLYHSAHSNENQQLDNIKPFMVNSGVGKSIDGQLSAQVSSNVNN